MRPPDSGGSVSPVHWRDGTGHGATIVGLCWLRSHWGHEGFMSCEPREEGQGVGEPGLDSPGAQDGAPQAAHPAPLLGVLKTG